MVEIDSVCGGAEKLREVLASINLERTDRPMVNSSSFFFGVSTGDKQLCVVKNTLANHDGVRQSILAVVGRDFCFQPKSVEVCRILSRN